MNIVRSKANHSTLLIISCTRCLSIQSPNFARLAEVGKLDDPSPTKEYKPGQFFLHKIFGYRGVILFPWRAKVYDRIQSDKKDEVDSEFKKSLEAYEKKDVHRKNQESTTIKKLHDDERPLFDQHFSASKKNFNQVSVLSTLFYQVLIDSRDCPFVRAQTEAVTFLAQTDNAKNIYSVPGLDYVSQDDVLPYSVAADEKHPLRHELFDKFLSQVKDPEVKKYEGSETLFLWQIKNHPWLEVGEVHREITENIRVTVMPFFMGSRKDNLKKVYWWRYSVRLENLGNVQVKLRERNWRIFSLSGTLETVRGRGVVGQEPVLNTRLPAFQYSSHVSLQAATGHMWGTFLMERPDGTTFDVRIPPFCLESEDYQSDFSDTDDDMY